MKFLVKQADYVAQVCVGMGLVDACAGVCTCMHVWWSPFLRRGGIFSSSVV
jgi:hypothetical protein